MKFNFDYLAYLIMGVLLFLTGNLLYAYVYDLEPLSAEKSYLHERDHYNATNRDWNNQFPSYAEWLGENEARESRMHEWLGNIAHETGMQFAEIWDPSVGQAPDNWAQGERE